MLETLSLILVALGVFVVYLTHNSTGLPRVGKSGPLGFIQTAIQSVLKNDELVAEGRKKFGGKPFVLPTLSGSMIIVGPENIDLIRTSDDTVINQPIAVNEGLQLDHTMNKLQQAHPYQAAVTRTDLTRAIGSFIPEVLDETRLSMEETFRPKGDNKSISVPLFHTLTHLIAQISNRAMLGTSLCRNPKFLHDIVAFAETLVLYARVLSWFPRITRGLLYQILSTSFGGPKQAFKFIVPHLQVLLKEREQGLERPNNIVEFLINNAPENELADAKLLAMRVVNLNFGSIHTSSIFGSHALFQLAALSKDQLESIRTEIIEAVESENGWNKASLAKMRKIDSTLREVGRVFGLGTMGLGRLLIKPATLADNTQVPAGYMMSIPLSSVHMNPEIYPNPEKFDCFRFSNLREQEKSDVKYGFTTIENNFLPFGLGRHACPGRFFAAMELKIMIAHILLNYDISFPEGQVGPPKEIRFSGAVVPDPKAHLVFTRREGQPGQDL